MKSEFSNWYRTKFNQLNEDPPQGTWENISNELDIEDVWTNVDFELQKISRRKLIRRNSSYFVTFLLLIGSGMLFFYYKTDSVKTLTIAQFPWNYSSNDVFNKYHFSHFEINNNKNKKITLHSNNTASNYPAKKIKLFSVNAVNNASQHLNKSQKHLKNKETILIETNVNLSDSKTTNLLLQNEIKQNISDSTGNSKDAYTLLFALIPISVYLPEKINPIVSSLEFVDLPDEKQSTNLIIGITFTYSNSWLLNNDTYDGFKKNSLNQTNLSFGNSYAALLGYDLSNKYTVQAEWSINNRQEQDYVRYYEGKQVHKKIVINYTYFDLLLKKKEAKFAFKNRMPVSFNYLAGIQYSTIKSISRTINGNTRSVKNRYRKNNYSLVLGVEYQLTVKHVWVISSGLRADIGMRNIYAGNAITPSSFNRTYNSSIGLNVGINYIIPIKRKK